MLIDESTDPINSPINPPEKVGLGFDQGVVSSDKGFRSQKDNEDNYWPHEENILEYEYIDYLIAGRLYIVADGVSGGLAGHEASQLAASTIAKSYYERILQLERPPEQNDVERALRDAVMTANQRLLARSRELRGETGVSGKKRYLQTAIICALLRGSTLTMANVGDCHLYRYRSGEVILLYEPKQPNFVGTNLSRNDLEIDHQPITNEDILVLCSDGLYKFLAPDNDPEKAPEEIKKIFKGYWSKGIEQITHQLLTKANDESNEGGGDNITVMLIRPGAASQQEAQDELDPLIRQAWGPNASPDDLIKVAKRCNQRALDARENAKKSQIWSRRAAQLGYEAPGAKELREARELTHSITLDFEPNYKLTQKIIELQKQAPEQRELAELTHRAVISLADSALIAPLQKERLEKARNLLLAEAKDEHKILSELEEELKNLSTTADGNSSDDFSRSSPSKQPKTTKPLRRQRPLSSTDGQTAKQPVRRRKRPEPRSVLDHPGIKPIIALSFMIIFLSCLLINLVLREPPPEVANGPSNVTMEPTTTITTPEPTPMVTTEVTEPSATVAPATATPSTPASASAYSLGLQIASPTYELLGQESGRKQIKLTTRLSISDTSFLDASSLDPNTMLEVETKLPAGLSPAGAGKPEVQAMQDLNTSEIIMTQRVPLSKVDPSNALFESIIIVEWPHSREPTYTILVTARLQGATGKELSSDHKTIEVEPIPHQAALSIAQSVTNNLATINDTLSFNVTITNTGQTWIDQIVVKSEQVPAGLNVDASQSELDRLGALEPGQSQQISLPMQVQTDKPMQVDLSIPLEGKLADGSTVEASTAPLQLEIYARGTTSLPAGFSLPHLLRELPGLGSNSNPTKYQLPNNSEVKVLGVAAKDLSDDNITKLIWFELEVITPDGEAIRGWLWNKRVALENEAVREFLIDKVNGD